MGNDETKTKEDQRMRARRKRGVRAMNMRHARRMGSESRKNESAPTRLESRDARLNSPPPKSAQSRLYVVIAARAMARKCDLTYASSERRWTSRPARDERKKALFAVGGWAISFLLLGGAAVHRCDNWLIFMTASEAAKRLTFVSGHRFSDAISLLQSDAFAIRRPFRGWGAKLDFFRSLLEFAMQQILPFTQTIV